MKTYPRQTVVAEKLDAIVALGFCNSRMKDYYGLWTLAHCFEFDGALLADAIKATLNAAEVADMLKTRAQSTIEEMDEAVAEAFRKSS